MFVVYVDLKINYILRQCVFVSTISQHLRWLEVDGWVRHHDFLRSYRACSSYEAAEILFNLLFIATLATCIKSNWNGPIKSTKEDRHFLGDSCFIHSGRLWVELNVSKLYSHFCHSDQQHQINFSSCYRSISFMWNENVCWLKPICVV